MIKNAVPQNRLIFFIKYVAIVLILFPITSAIAGVTGFVDGIASSSAGYALNGWACEIGNPNPISIQVYVGGAYMNGGSLVASLPKTNAASETAISSACGTSGNNYRFSIQLPSSVMNNYLSEIYVYGTTGNTMQALNNSGLIAIPLTVMGNQQIQLGSAGTGWAADGTNYFTKWSCTSNVGLKYITKLNIKPLGKPNKKQWKDSLFAGQIAPNSAGNPILFFTIGDEGVYDSSGQIWKAEFAMVKAKYDQASGSWQTTQYLTDPNAVSSHDGTETAFIFNKYWTKGWGPFVSDVSKFLGTDPQNRLSGTGPLGLSTIRETPQPYNTPSRYKGNTDSCLFMNPSLFNYDSNGFPNSFIATVWTPDWTSETTYNSKGCLLPSGNILLPGPYVFKFKDWLNGWQLDTTSGLIEDQGGLDYAMNSDPTQNGVFIRSDWSGKVMRVTGVFPDNKTSSAVLDCSNSYPKVNFSEASKGLNGAYYFLADEHSMGTNEWSLVHDVFVAH